MEDTYKVALGFTDSPVGGEPAYDFFAVYDGHGGSAVATMCRDNLHLVLAEEVGRLWRLAGEELGELELWQRAMADCFDRVDREMLLTVPTDIIVGSTAVVAVVGTRSIIIANCGDSRAVLCRDGMAVPVTSDHKVRVFIYGLKIYSLAFLVVILLLHAF